MPGRVGRRVIDGPLSGDPMRAEKEKMLAGELYDPLDPELVRARERARDLCQNWSPPRGTLVQGLVLTMNRRYKP